MNVVHVVWSMGIGGTENMLVDIMNVQSKSCVVTLIVINDRYSPEIMERIDDKVRVLKIERKEGSRNIASIVKLNYIILRLKADVIHCHTPNIIKTIIIRPFVSSKFCVTCHDTNIHFNSYNLYDVIFAISKTVMMDVDKRYGMESIIVQNGVDFNAILRKSSIHSKDTVSIVQVGRLDHKKKGQEVMLKAMHHLVYNMAIKNIRYVLIGDGPSKQFLIKRSGELKVEDYCRFLGALDRKEIYSTLKDYDMLVQPSFYEGFGLTIVEGMAACLPVIVPDNEGPADIVQNGKYGYVFSCGDYVDLAGKVVKVIENYGSADYEKWLVNNYEYAKQNYDVTNTAKRYEEEYKAVVNK
jgi:glycosyltransferase involved in cell wall biosynthesis